MGPRGSAAIDEKSYERVTIACERVRADRGVLDRARQDVRIHLSNSGSNWIEFNPFLARVVDASNNEHCFDVVTTTLDRGPEPYARRHGGGSRCPPSSA